MDPEVPAIDGAGSVELFEGSTVDGPIEGSVDLLIAEGWDARISAATLSDTVRLDVEGELVRPNSSLVLEDAASVHVSGVHRVTDAGSNDPFRPTSGTNGSNRVVNWWPRAATGRNSTARSSTTARSRPTEVRCSSWASCLPSPRHRQGAFVAHDGGEIFLPGGTLGDGSEPDR